MIRNEFFQICYHLGNLMPGGNSMSKVKGKNMPSNYEEGKDVE